MRFLCCVVLICLEVALADDWVMFNDGKDTYIYNTKSGEIYIRHSMGKANYEDIFVKMPRGAQPNEVKNGRFSQSMRETPNAESEKVKEMQLNALKKAQDMLNSALD